MTKDHFFLGLLGAWPSAEAATDFTLAGVFGSRSSSLALVATDFDVFSFGCFLAVAMRTPPVGKVGSGWYLRPEYPGNADGSRRKGFSLVATSRKGWRLLQRVLLAQNPGPFRPASVQGVLLPQRVATEADRFSASCRTGIESREHLNIDSDSRCRVDELVRKPFSYKGRQWRPD